MASGHLWLERMRMIDRSISLSDAAALVDVGKYQSARNNRPSSMPPTNTKYRTRGIGLTAIQGRISALVPTFRSPRYIAATPFRGLRKVMGTSKFKILV